MPPQVGCQLEETVEFCDKLAEVVESVPRRGRVVTGVDVNGCVGKGTRDDEVLGSSDDACLTRRGEAFCFRVIEKGKGLKHDVHWN
ncbi:ethanolamine kinase [Sarotherodon galilaeus]